jgi:hypothetical protein
VKQLEAEPYQIGKNNPEGIASGAFWFYYRLGFRPKQQHLYELAEEENLKIKQHPGYRTTQHTLGILANSMMVLECENPGERKEVQEADASAISRIITAYIGHHYKGDRLAAEQESWRLILKTYGSKKVNQLDDLQKESLKKLSLVFLAAQPGTNWKKNELEATWKWMISKGNKHEIDSVKMSRTCERLFGEVELKIEV